MDHRMVLHRRNLPCCWSSLPPIKPIATGSDVPNAQELGAMRRAQEEGVANKKKTHKSSGEWNMSLSFYALLEFPQKKNCLSPLMLLGSWKRSIPRPHYPTTCICGLLLRGRGSNYYCPYCGNCLCPRHWDCVLCWCQCE
jgi:hypothetical protein